MEENFFFLFDRFIKPDEGSRVCICVWRQENVNFRLSKLAPTKVIQVSTVAWRELRSRNSLNVAKVMILSCPGGLVHAELGGKDMVWFCRDANELRTD